MLFLVALQNFVVLHTRSDTRPCWSIEDAEGNTDDKITLSWTDDGAYLYFPVNAEIIHDAEDPSAFTVKDIDGDTIQFNAYTPANLSGGFTTSFTPDDHTRLNVQVGKFDVLLNHTHEGIIVDVWPRDPHGIYNGDSLATCAVQNDDADEAMEPDPDAKWDAENGQGPTETGFKIAPTKSVAEALREWEANQGPQTVKLEDFVSSGEYVVTDRESGMTVNASMEEVDPENAYDTNADELYTQVELYWTHNYSEHNMYFRGDAIVTIENGIGKVTSIDGEEFDFNVFRKVG